VLKRRDASIVKDGDNWYQNRSIDFLVRELLKLEFGAENSGDLPETFYVQSNTTISNPDGQRTLSLVGQTPDYTDTNGDGVADAFLERNLVCHAMVMAPTPSNMATGTPSNRVYLGCDNQLIMYDPSTSTYRLIDDTSLGATYQIRNLWWSSVNKAIYGCAFDADGDDRVETAVKFFKYNGSSFTLYSPTDAGGYLSHAMPMFLTTRGHDTILSTEWIGQESPSVDSGENLTVPFQQYIDSRTNVTIGTDANGEIDNIFALGDQDVYSVASNVSNYTVRRGYFNSSTSVATNKDIYGIAYSFGQKGGVSFDETNQTFYFFAAMRFVSVGAAEDPRLMKFVVSTNTVSTVLTTTLVENSKRLYPLCVNDVIVSGQLYFSSIVPYGDDDGVTQKSRTYIHKFDTTSLVLSTLYSSSADTVSFYYTPIEMKVIGSRIFLSVFQRDKLFDGLAYFVGTYVTTVPVSSTPITIYSQTISATPWAGFAQGIDNTNVIYAVRAGAGTLYEVTITAHTSDSGVSRSIGDVTILDDGFPIIETEFFLSAGLIVDNQTTSGEDVIWGVSAPYYDEWTQELRPAGKYLLFKFDTSILPKIELADFDGLSVWEAITYLAEVANCNMGFDAHGNFFFIKRGEINSSDDHTFYHDFLNSLVLEIDEDDGKDEVFNYATITPSFVKFELPSYEAFLVERVSADEDADTANEDEIQLKQTDQKRKSVRMICVQEGNANCGDGLVGYPKFKYLVFETTTSTRLAEDVEASETDIELASVFGGTNDLNGVHKDDYLIFTNPTTDTEEIRRITGGSGGVDSTVDPDDNIVYISSAIGFPLKVNDEVIIQRKFRRSSTDNTGNRWSDDGVSYITTTATSATHTVSSIRNLSVNTVVVIGNNERRILSIDSTANTVTFNSSVSLTAGDVIRAYWSPDNSGEYFEIGGTKVWIKIDCGTNNAMFKRGDSITVTCPGLVIQQDEMSKQVAYDTLSVSTYGKKLYPTIENRFMTRKIAKIKAKEIVSEYKHAVQILTVAIPFAPYLNLITETGNKLLRVGIVSKTFFPNLPNHKVSGYVRKIVHSPTTGHTALEIRGITPY
jgi:hypothetical protein